MLSKSNIEDATDEVEDGNARRPVGIGAVVSVHIVHMQSRGASCACTRLGQGRAVRISWRALTGPECTKGHPIRPLETAIRCPRLDVVGQRVWGWRC